MSQESEEVSAIKAGVQSCIETARRNIANLEERFAEASKEKSLDRMLWLMGTAVCSYEESLQRAAPHGLSALISRMRARLGNARRADELEARARKAAESL